LINYFCYIIKSEAGNYLSIQNIDSLSKQKLKIAIFKVIKSYLEKGNNDSKNQILVQKQALDIISSGVIFTNQIIKYALFRIC
jgi:glutamine kinase